MTDTAPMTVQEAAAEAIAAAEAADEQAEVEDQGATQSEEQPPSKELTEDDVPTEYFGEQLGDLPPEVRQRIIDTYKAKDSRITKLEQRLAEQRKAEEENPASGRGEEAPELPPIPSDEEILALYDITPDHPYYEVAKAVALPLAKQNLILAGNFETMKQQVEADQAWNVWNDTLDSLESEYGKLPVERDVIFEFAAEQGIYDPEVAYMKMAFAAKKVIGDAATQERVKSLEALREKKKQQGGGLRPAGIPKTESKPIPADIPIDQAIKQAAKEAEEEFGVSFGDAAQQFLEQMR